MSLADDLIAAKMKHRVSFQRAGTTYGMLAGLCKHGNKAAEIYEMAALAIHIGVFSGSIEELAIKSCIRFLDYDSQSNPEASQIVADTIKYDFVSPTVIICTPLKT